MATLTEAQSRTGRRINIRTADTSGALNSFSDAAHPDVAAADLRHAADLVPHHG